MEEPYRQPYADLIAAVTAPAAEAGRRVMIAHARRVVPSPVPCPRCGQPCALWSPWTRRLHATGPGGGFGPALGGSRANVAVRCDRCQVTWHTSGRAVGRNLHNGRPLLA
jgi:hypothetical protein